MDIGKPQRVIVVEPMKFVQLPEEKAVEEIDFDALRADDQKAVPNGG
ncbi:MAG: hypothetical protein IIB04_01340 [Acidobacteria bacterium]|nr:hypothetical protein [Acidobacteriota bacterium]MCH8985239.1 hypothetical protein [Acidobacteriota bacterium]